MPSPAILRVASPGEVRWRNRGNTLAPDSSYGFHTICCKPSTAFLFGRHSWNSLNALPRRDTGSTSNNTGAKRSLQKTPPNTRGKSSFPLLWFERVAGPLAVHDLEFDEHAVSTVPEIEVFVLVRLALDLGACDLPAVADDPARYRVTP